MEDIINDNFFLKGSGFSNYENTTEIPRHRWYYYKEGFSPNFVEKAIEQTGVTKKDLIIDPFNGSGTTTLTSALLGYNSIGIEVNPFTSFLSSAKLKMPNVKQLKVEFENLYDACGKGTTSDLAGYSTFSYKTGLTKWLFNHNILKAFDGGWKYISQIKNSDIKNVLQLSLIVSVMENCNAVRDGKCLRYRKLWKSYHHDRESFIDSIRKKSIEIVSDISTHPILGKSIIVQGDVRKILDSKKINNKFKLCFTSPPYLNTFDYTDIYRPELFLGKFINDSEQLYNLRLKTVRSHLQALWHEPKLSDFGILYKETVDYISENQDLLMHKRIPKMIQAYFEDMFNILKKLKDKADKNAQLWLIVSNSAYANKEIPVDLIIGDIGTKAGWYLKEIGVIRYVQKRKTIYSPDVKELRESVIIFSESRP
ncbi:MAG TPA: DNA methyltransferase [Puia sp.]|jgi:DNA modification methylase|nr:DNA methyltransferase [Puia sp.]